MKLMLLINTVLFFTIAHSRAQRMSLPHKESERMATIMKLNETLHAHFFKYDENAVGKWAMEISQKLSKIEDPKVKAILAGNEDRLKKLSSENSRKTRNDLYHQFSQDLAKLIKQYQLKDPYNVYYCPMIKQRWIQNSKTLPQLSNPYAPWMPHCGEQETHYK